MEILNQELRDELSQNQGKDRKEEQEMETEMRMNDGIKYLAVAVCSAIVTYPTASCTAGLVIEHNQM